jgi:hypothetical protein
VEIERSQAGVVGYSLCTIGSCCLPPEKKASPGKRAFVRSGYRHPDDEAKHVGNWRNRNQPNTR